MEDGAARRTLRVLSYADLEAREVELENSTALRDTRHGMRGVVRDRAGHHREVRAPRAQASQGARRDQSLCGLGQHASDGRGRQACQAKARPSDPYPKTEVPGERELIRHT